MVKSRNAERKTDNGAPATDASGGPAVGGGVSEQRHAAERVLPQSGFELEHLDRHLRKRRWKRKKKSRPGDGQLVAVELAIRKSPTEHERSCRLVVVLAGGRRIEVQRDFDTHRLERLVSVLERV